MNDELTIINQLETLRIVVKELINFYQQPTDFNKKVYTHWSAKDVLGHVTFWHESFARNLLDLAEGRKPNPLKGKLSEVNNLSVSTTKENTIQELLDRLEAAQNIINKHILNDAIIEIPYKKGSRNYTRLEHLGVVEGHLKKHLKDLKKACQTQ
ncbi:MAG: hypothetical protein H6587_02335 [Flavobacteriales bacterium]|nr:hypothetical protein [Flavobacteriales bacterium]MCB9363384.1 hypothetical protein [Flavobacteriales bacterium]